MNKLLANASKVTTTPDWMFTVLTPEFCPVCQRSHSPTSAVNGVMHCKCGNSFPVQVPMLTNVTAQKDLQAALMSTVLPGAGQFYRGNRPAGIIWLAITAMGYFFLIIPGIIFHALCVVNAYKVDHAQLHARNVASTAIVSRKDDD